MSIYFQSDAAAALRDAAELVEAMEKLRELSQAATPGPWIRKWASMNVHHMGGDDALRSQEDVDLAVAAVNLVREYIG